MSGVTVDGERLSSAGRDFESKVRATARDRLHSRGHRTSVRVTWSPYPDAPVKSEYRVGDRPPATVDVRAATVTVPSGMGNISEPVHEQAETGVTGSIQARIVQIEPCTDVLEQLRRRRTIAEHRPHRVAGELDAQRRQVVQ
jgi:hypothetical protein